MKFRKKPVVIEAELFIRGKQVNGVFDDVNLCPTCPIDENRCIPHVHTIHNNQRVNVESYDYIVPEPNGVNYYPIKHSIFHAAYEAVI